VVVFGQSGLEIGCGDMVWASLITAPLHEEAIAQAQDHSRELTWSGGRRIAHTAVVVARDIQVLMQTALNASSANPRAHTPVGRAEPKPAKRKPRKLGLIRLESFIPFLQRLAA
jgi:hypothetical protein